MVCQASFRSLLLLFAFCCVYLFGVSSYQTKWGERSQTSIMNSNGVFLVTQRLLRVPKVETVKLDNSIHKSTPCVQHLLACIDNTQAVVQLASVHFKWVNAHCVCITLPHHILSCIAEITVFCTNHALAYAYFRPQYIHCMCLQLYSVNNRTYLP